VTVDNSPPTISISSPAPGATVAGMVLVSNAHSDNVGVAGVQFKLDGINLGAEVTAAPYAVSWDTTLVANGPRTLTAVARDAAGNTATSAAVSVTVDNSPPTISISSPAPGATVAGTVTVSASATDNVSVAWVQFKLDGRNLGARVTVAPYTLSWTTTTTTNGAHTLTAVARDAAGNTATSAAVSLTVANDTTPPTVSITAPAAGATVAGPVTVSASATDNVGVVGVQFKLDGANLGAEVTAAPYSVLWTSTLATSGAHSLTAVARDAAGNTSTSAAVSVTVDNAPPTVSLTAPSAGATVAGPVTVSASAVDNVGVLGVQFKLDGANLGAEVTVAPYTLSWTTTTTINGAHTLTAVARDAVGNLGTAAEVSVTVANDTSLLIISLVAASDISSSGATITWTTSLPSDSQVEYGPTIAYGSSAPLNTSLVTSHAQTLIGLAANTLYHYRVRSRDAAGNLAISADFTLMTFAVVRSEQGNPAVSYSGIWDTISSSGYTSGSAVRSASGGAQATLSFNGTAVSWIGYRDPSSGIARVYIDGSLYAKVDTYASVAEAQAVILSISGLPLGPHTLTIEVMGAQNPASGGTWIWVDAFDVAP